MHTRQGLIFEFLSNCENFISVCWFFIYKQFNHIYSFENSALSIVYIMPSVSEGTTAAPARASVDLKSMSKEVRFDDKNTAKDSDSANDSKSKPKAFLVSPRSDDVSTNAGDESELNHASSCNRFSEHKSLTESASTGPRTSGNNVDKGQMTVFTMGGDDIVIRGTRLNPFDTLVIEDAQKVVADFLTRKAAYQASKNKTFNENKSNFDKNYYEDDVLFDAAVDQYSEVSPASTPLELDALYELGGSCVADLEALVKADCTNGRAVPIPVPANIVGATAIPDTTCTTDGSHLNKKQTNFIENIHKMHVVIDKSREQSNALSTGYSYGEREIHKNTRLHDLVKHNLSVYFVALPADKALERTEFNGILKPLIVNNSTSNAVSKSTSSSSFASAAVENSNTEDYYNGPRFFNIRTGPDARAGEGVRNPASNDRENNNNPENPATVNMNSVVQSNIATPEFKRAFANYATSVKCNLDLVEMVSSLDKKLQLKKLLELLYVAPEEIIFRARQGFFLALLQNLWRDQGGLGMTSTARSRLSFWGTSAAGVDLDCVKLFFNFWIQKMREIGLINERRKVKKRGLSAKHSVKNEKRAFNSDKSVDSDKNVRNTDRSNFTDETGYLTEEEEFQENLEKITNASKSTDEEFEFSSNRILTFSINRKKGFTDGQIEKMMANHVHIDPEDNRVSPPCTPEWREIIDKLVSALVLKVPDETMGSGSSKEFHCLLGGGAVVSENKDVEAISEPANCIRESQNYAVSQPTAFNTGLNLFSDLIATMPHCALSGSEENFHRVLMQTCLPEEDLMRGKPSPILGKNAGCFTATVTVAEDEKSNSVKQYTEKPAVLSDVPSNSNVALHSSSIRSVKSDTLLTPRTIQTEDENDESENDENDDDDESDNSNPVTTPSSASSDRDVQAFDNTFVFRNVSRNLLSNFFILGKSQNGSDANSTMLLQRVARLNLILKEMRESSSFDNIESLRYLFMTRFSFHPFPRPYMKNERFVDFARYLLLFCRERRDSETGLCELSRNSKTEEEVVYEEAINDDSDDESEDDQDPENFAQNVPARRPGNDREAHCNSGFVKHGPLDVPRGFGSKKSAVDEEYTPNAMNERTARKMLSKKSGKISNEDILFRRVRLECLKTCVLLIRWRAEYRTMVRGKA